MPPRISIIVPVLDEGSEIAQALQRLSVFRRAGAEVIVVDGGSTDDTTGQSRPHCDLTLSAPRGRGSQMNAGAPSAQGEVLLFLHADTVLPPDALTRIHEAVEAGALWGRFDIAIDGQSRWFPLIGFTMNLRSRWTGIATGDQAIFVTRQAFLASGGFPDIPLMEDVAFSSQMRARAKPACLRSKVTTSGRRWEKHGVLRTILKMWSLRWRYFLGADPKELALDYGYRPRHD